ncbi:glutaredoxin domain-containing protein, partial [Aquimonas sp.]|uniref:glutaredoxin domain-containing protein n=1 Tax=Aquimonas sp. TaxID=1872588 RepID=UPI0037BF38B9
SRPILDEQQLHPAIRLKISSQHADLISEVQKAAATHPLLVVGMAGNPFVGRARKALTESGLAYEYIGIGSYFSQWRPRLALKMWTGWPTFPMVFVRGQLIGGAEDLRRLIAAGELKSLLAE